MKLKFRTILILHFSFLILLVNSCKTEVPDTSADSESIVTEEVETDNTGSIFYSIPSPMELGALLHRAGVSYNSELLNPTDKASQYIGTSSKALNLGVYVADLSYTTASNKMQESMNYLNSARILSEELGLKSFSGEMMLEIEKNLDKKDELIKLVSEAYQSSNETLTENDRETISILAITGGWIEGIYIGTQIAKTNANNSGIIKMIAEQRTTLDNLISQMKPHKSNLAIGSLLNSLNDLKKIYDETPVGEASAEIDVREGSNQITIGGTSGFSLSDDQFSRITKTVDEIRTSIVKI
ncbi:MAG: hypothetical protein H0V01_00535 [Bacteroidetes bacterium]|nr:hypothetical protein [Bacteroidota bacterium]HET6245637.1 hypothetical protein [Bacteroidia bacterium]